MSKSADGANAHTPAQRRGHLALLLLGALGLLALWMPDRSPSPPAADEFGGTLDCRQQPRFVTALGFTTGAALSTGEADMPGLVLVDIADPGRNYQHLSWSRQGPLGAFTFDADGNVYVAPTPGLRLSEHSPEEQNTIYRVDSAGGELAAFVRLTPAGPLSAENPFGILGITYDCDSNSLFASSVAGSSRTRERGRIVSIDPADGEVKDDLPEVDAMGLAVFRNGRSRRLYYGKARQPEIWSVALDPQGGFQAPARRELLLPEWTDKARRIVFDADGGMEVRVVPFVFNLAVSSESSEREYGFRYDSASNNWRLETSP